MSEAEFIGMFFIVILPVIISFMALVKPILNLTKVLTEVGDDIKALKREGETRQHRLDAHGDRLFKLETKSTEHEIRIQHLEDKK